MLPETVIAVLALGRLRAVFTPIFSGYAAPAVAARLEAFEATHLITADGFYRRGAVVALKAVADAAVALAPTVRRVIVVRRLPDVPIELDHDRDVIWDDADPGAAADDEALDAVPPTDPEQPYMVIYTSGTTGRPKGTVHVHGGFPIKAAQDLAHTFDLRRGDALCWFTDLGWMMGPWAISGALLLGARLVIYEGAPDWPDPGRLWQLVASHRITHMGVSPTLIRALRVHGDESRPRPRPLEPADPRLDRRALEPRPLAVAVLNGRRRAPADRQLQRRDRGQRRDRRAATCSARSARPRSTGRASGWPPTSSMPAAAPVRGSVGELAIRQPWPGMTRGFWAEPDDERYLETYWRRVPGLWLHGDFAATDADGYWYIHGRSDDTLKVAGKRVGPAEVEACAVAHPAVMAAAAIGVPDDLKGEAIVVLCVPRPGVAWDAAIALEVSQRVVAELGKPVRPKAVVAVTDLPRTRSGKVMRRVARAAYLGIDPGDLSALENPAALTSIEAGGRA